MNPFRVFREISWLIPLGLCLSALFVAALAGCIPLEKMGEEGEPCSAGGACLPGYACVQDVCVKAGAEVDGGGSDGAAPGDGGGADGSAGTDGATGDAGCVDECADGDAKCEIDLQVTRCERRGDCWVWGGPMRCGTNMACDSNVNDCAPCGGDGERCCENDQCNNGFHCKVVEKTCERVLCDSSSCSSGCCDSLGNCQIGTNDNNCGKGGFPCAVCTVGKTCDAPSHTCVDVLDGGTGDGGTEDGGLLLCNGVPCEGCCEAAICLPGDEQHRCGKGGGECTNCGTDQCTSAGACGPDVKCGDGTCSRPAENECKCAADCNPCQSPKSCVNDECVDTSDGGTDDGGMCTGGETQDQECGNCGTQSRTCAGGTWSSWGACAGEGPCSEGAIEACDCGGGLFGTRTCGKSCTWSNCANCQAPDGGTGDDGGMAAEDDDVTCSDGIDNDVNSKTDCQEPSCEKMRCDTVHGFCSAQVCTQACRFGGTLLVNGTEDAVGCGTCDIAMSDSQWTWKPVGAACVGDGLECTNEECNGAGVCLHPNKPDGTSCAIGKCQGGQCIAQKPNGSACMTGAECTSGFCVDAYCCDRACAGACEACSMARGAPTNGACAVVADGADPKGACWPYTCGSGSCRATCTSPDCAAGFTCSSGECRAPCYPNCPTVQMVSVAAGSFWMGCNDAVDTECQADGREAPYHQVWVPAFKIDKHETTVSDFAACVTNSGCTAADTGSGCNFNVAGKENHPINCVDWNRAKAYCTWVGKRLPAEAEWEKTARGTDGRKYPWGNDVLDCNRAVHSVSPCSNSGTATVGSKPTGVSPYGAMDMVGNVWEFTEDDWHSGYTGAPNDGSPWIDTPRAEWRVYRGGAFSGNNPAYLRSSVRAQFPFDTGSNTLGFRCAISGN